jgi:hypothetical protein
MLELYFGMFRDLWHYVLHGKIEVWEFVSIRLDDDGNHYSSSHNVTCPKCSHERVQKMAQPNYRGLKRTLEEATANAKAYTALSIHS